MRPKYESIKGVEEKQFVKAIMNASFSAYHNNRPFLTDFYNKEWMEGLLSLYGESLSGVSYYYFGGYEEAERQRLYLSPFEVEKESFEISVLKVMVRTGIGKKLSHRDYLGAILGLGICRHVVGDILLMDWGAYVLVESNMAFYLQSHLTAIGKYQKIEVEEVGLEEIEINEPSLKEISTTVSALRVDAVTCAMFGLSRSACTKLAQGEKIRCNGLVVTGSQLMKENDVIVLRGYGKARLKQVNGHTKKDRLHIIIEKYV